MFRSVLSRYLISNNSFSKFNFRYAYSTSTGVELTPAQKRNIKRVSMMRNIGVSAHIDSGKTTLTERILYYTGKIKEIHEVKGKDGIGAKMDSMDLEREKGITIQSAATFVRWKNHHINIIDTPGHVDFTIEVERALRVLDGAILVLCAVGGVQSQTYTVDRQMKRYKIPRIVFINKCDRLGADPWKGIDQINQKLNLNARAIQIPMGLGGNMTGVIDLVQMKAYYSKGDSGEILEEQEIPENFLEFAQAKRAELLENLSVLDDELLEMLIEEKKPSLEKIKSVIRQNVISNKFVPVFMGSAIKNKGVQMLLDGVVDYLPSPGDIFTEALDPNDEEIKVKLECDSSLPLVAYSFKLKDDKFGQLSWIRVYQGTIKRSDQLNSLSFDKKYKVPRLVRMHSDEIEEIDKLEAGDIAAMIGPEVPVGITFTDGRQNVVMQSMHVPDSVISFSITNKAKEQDKNMMKALRRFQNEDPTFKLIQDHDTNELLISGMGELHLEIYVERLRREYGVQVQVGQPRVAYKETISNKGEFEYLHRKQSGGQGQFAKVCGYLEPIDIDDNPNLTKEFVDQTIGGSIPPHFMPAVNKGFEEMIQHGPNCGFPVVGVRMVVNDGAFHSVDSSELAFRVATHGAFKQGFERAGAEILEPWMELEVVTPMEFQTQVISGINRRRGVIIETRTDGDQVTIDAQVALALMFGYATEVRSATQGKASFTMEYLEHREVTRDQFKEIKEKYKDNANIII